MRYNVLEIISDQHQARCMGHEGHRQALTPRLDGLAAGGTRCTGAYTQSPICTPSRVSVLSGQYCHNHGYFGLSGPTPERLDSFLAHFRRRGYRTAAIGKLHLPDDPVDWLVDTDAVDLWAECYGRARRAEAREVYGGRDSVYHDELEALGLKDREDSGRLPEYPDSQNAFLARPSTIPFDHCVERWCVEKATAFMDASGDTPWCMQVSFPRPHQYYTPDRRFWDLFDENLELPATFDAAPDHRGPHFRDAATWMAKLGQWPDPVVDWRAGARRIWRGYLACIAQVDHCVGLLLDHLEATGQADRTIVVYHADHGAYSTCFGLPEKAPGICSELVCRTPMLWRVPGVTPDGAVVDALVENIDLAPTFCALCDLPPMDAVDGHDITGLLRGHGAPVRDQAVTEHPWSRSLRFGPWRYVHYPRGMFDQPWDFGELYHIEDDPDETTNLYDDPDHAPVVAEAHRRLLDFALTTGRFRTALSLDRPAGSDGRKIIPRRADGRPELRELNYL